MNPNEYKTIKVRNKLLAAECREVAFIYYRFDFLTRADPNSEWCY